MFNEIKTDLLKALTSNPQNFTLAKKLLKQGANINDTNFCGDSIIEECLHHCARPYLDDEEEEPYNDGEKAPYIDPISIVDFFIQNGWNTERYGLDAVSALVHTTHDDNMFYAAKHILNCPTSKDEEDFDYAIESACTEESFQRCCEHCHEQENLYYALVELVDAKKNNRDIDGIHPYSRAIGKRIDKIVYFSNIEDFKNTHKGSEFNEDFGFICGNELLVIKSSINILFMNECISNEPQIEVTEYFKDGITGSEITDITFGHKSITKNKITYGQPEIIIKLNSGKNIHFTHNFGEVSDKKVKSRFWIT